MTSPDASKEAPRQREPGDWYELGAPIGDLGHCLSQSGVRSESNVATQPSMATASCMVPVCWELAEYIVGSPVKVKFPEKRPAATTLELSALVSTDQAPSWPRPPK